MADLRIDDARIFDGTPELVEGSILIRDGRIVEVGRRAGAGADVPVIDAHGKVVTPGLIDAHFHAYAVSLHTETIETGHLSYLALVARERLEAALRRGFTTVRDVAGGDRGLGRAIEEGRLVSPRYLYTGAALSQTGGHGEWRGSDTLQDACGGHMCEIVDGVDAVRRVVRERFRTGAHAIKIMASGGVVSLTDPIRLPQYSAAEVQAIAEEAAHRDSYVAAHAYSPEAIAHAVRNGVRSIEHGNLLDEETAALMASSGAYLVPTLGAYDAMDRRGEEMHLDPLSQAKNREVLAAGAVAVERAMAAGVPVGFGSDHMGDLADDQLVGVRLQAEVQGALETLRSLTEVNASLLQTERRLVEGDLGDLVIWDGDPLEDFSVVTDESRPRTVVLGGVVVRE